MHSPDQAIQAGAVRLYRSTTSSWVFDPQGTNRLANTYLDFRKVRVGLGADLKLGNNFTLGVDLGFVTDRKFDYYDRDFILDGDAGFYGTVALRTHF